MDKRSAAEGRERGSSSQKAFRRVHQALLSLADPDDVKPLSVLCAPPSSFQRFSRVVQFTRRGGRQLVSGELSGFVA